MAKSDATASVRLSRATAVRIVTFVIAMLVLLDVFTRVKLFKMSKDFRSFMEFPEGARKVDGGRGIALIGNSATRRGIDPGIVSSTLASERNERIDAEIFAADASRINTWRYMLESTFWRPHRKPRMFVLTFYEDDLADGNRVEIGRVAQFFTTTEDWPEIFRIDLPTFSQRAEFVVSSFWATYAARARIRERVLQLVMGYDDYAVHQNEVVFTHERRRSAASQQIPRSNASEGARPHGALERLLTRARAEGSRLCFVAYPTLESARGKPYELDVTARKLVEDAGMKFLDLRRVEGLTPELYEDDVHLGEAGRALYSKVVATALAGLL